MSNIESFKPESLNIKSIFKNDDVRYRIPDYQRRYSWKDDELDALWGDLYEAYTNSIDCYFLGSIVVVKNGTYFDLIDGQQRLTTLTIMTSVLNATYPEIECVNPKDDEDVSNTIDKETFLSCLFIKPSKGTERLVLQTAAEYGSDFSVEIIKRNDFSNLKKPTKSQLKSGNPKFCFLNTAKFFYDKFNELSPEERESFIFYIFNNVKLIRITCVDVSFAIKLFQVLNDRGMPLSSSDIIKSYVMGEIDKSGNEEYSKIFTANWKYIEDIVTKHELKMDDFMVCYEYFKLKSNPKRQVIDELKEIIRSEEDIGNIINEFKIFAEKLDNVYSSTDNIIYSLRYIPWKFYVTTALVSAEYVNYEDKESLFKLIRRYFYLAFISGKTLNQIKQTSFKLIESIVDRKSLEEIDMLLTNSINKYKMIKNTYENLSDDVFGENYLKPLMLSLEYEQREALNNSFIEINNNLHMDHILPKAFTSEKDWEYVNKEDGKQIINTFGNMALLHCKKNEEALNKGFATKANIYLGKNPDGSVNGSGITCFDTTKEIADVKFVENRLWSIDDIKRRYETQMSRVEKMLNISQEMINDSSIQDDSGNIKTARVPNFSFSELSIPTGSILYWYNDKNIQCTVLDERKVLYNGREMFLTGVAKEILGKEHLNGALYFTYNNETISEIYQRFIKETNN